MRPYQKNFYKSSPRVRDEESRKDKASKIADLLKAHSKINLATSICADIGCSSGVITETLTPLFRHIIGLEYDWVGLKNIRDRRLVGPSFLQGDAMFLPFADESIDFMICAQIYEHVPNDEILFAEIYRTLRPGGLVFFSGPNKLYPIEPHYFLPFLHWLPQELADRYLKLFHLGDHYYERSRTLWGLRKLMRAFEINDVTLQVIIRTIQQENSTSLGKLLKRIPFFMWRLLLPVIPNYNWIIQKPIMRNKA